MENSDRRRQPRHDCDNVFEGSLPEAAKKPAHGFRCHAVNASTGGLMLETQNKLEIGQQIELTLRARDDSRSFVAQAEIMWCEPYGEAYHCGVKFLSRREDYMF